nr:MAG: phosphosulfolactate synthase [Bacillota bacterium]
MEPHGAPWTGILTPPIPGRSLRPRRTGITVVMDKGLGPAACQDLLAVSGAHIDFWKFGFGTAALHPPARLAEKLAALRAAGVCPYPGGTLLEAAAVQGQAEAFLERARALGFEAAEVSEGTIPLSPRRRRELIAAARGLGLRVLAEVGKKDPAAQPSPEALAEQALADLEAGAEYVIIEGRESGRGVGIYGPAGQVREEWVETLAARLPVEKVIWEAPRKEQQQALILRFGPNVNLGNIPPEEAMALEALRVGLRGDTLAAALGRGFATGGTPAD